MRTQTIDKTIFSFADLSTNKGLKAKVLEKYAYINVEHEWHNFTIEDFKEICSIIGLKVSNTYFSGFYSQGDGACFVGSYRYRKNSINDLKAYAPQGAELHRIAKELQVLQKKTFYNTFCEITHSGRYYHEGTMNFSLSSNDERFENLIYSLENDFEELFKDLAIWLYKALENEYNYLTSEEIILQTLESNGYEFTEDGNIY
jgi:hypothetical protein